MNRIILGALIEAAGFAFFVIGGIQQGFPPSAGWLVPAVVMVVAGNGLVVLTIVSKIAAGKKTPRE